LIPGPPSACAGRSPVPSLFGLAPGGVCRAACVAAGAVRSYRTVSPLPASPSFILRHKRRRIGWGAGGLFSVALSLGSRPPDVIRHRMSMEPGLSSRTHLSASARAAVRPTDALRDGVRAGDRQACSCGAAAGSAESCAFSCSQASRAASSAFSVATVETSMLPSTRCGRKWRWKAATTARVTPSK
jgi:hypothetical protein